MTAVEWCREHESRSPTPPATAGSPAASPSGTGNAPWPRDFSEGGRTYVIYQPQIEKWDGTRLHAQAAVSVAPASVVVYGTGYVYPPVYVGAYYYPAPVTYGYGAGFASRGGDGPPISRE